MRLGLGGVGFYFYIVKTKMLTSPLFPCIDGLSY